MRDYSKRTIYLGMDVHKLSYSITAICDDVIVKRDRLTADPEALVAYCKKFFPNALIKSAYEAGFCGFNLHRLLTANGIDNIVVHPAAVEVVLNERVKTDKRDSLKIAVQLSSGRLRGIYVPSLEREQLRSVSRQRDSWSKEKTRVACKLKGFLHYHGIDIKSKRLSKILISYLQTLEQPREIKFCLQELISAWLFYCNKIEAANARLALQALDDELEKFYRSVPGIGPTVARILANELGDMSQFNNEKKLFSYCGLTPWEYSSGETSRKGHITRQGKSVLRKSLTQSAWVAVSKDPALREDFERIGIKAGAKRAIQAIARKLIGRTRACLKNKKFYECGQKVSQVKNEGVLV